MKNLIIGYGQIGMAVHEVIGDAEVFDIGYEQPKLDFYVMHICFPYTEGFIEQVQSYIKKYDPRHVIIYSTVPIGTTKKIPNAVHSPIEGKHPELADSIRLMLRFIGYNDEVEGEFFYRFFREKKILSKMVKNSDHTEALKLLSTTEYGINIEFARYKKHVADSIGMSYDLTKTWNQAYNELYNELQLPNYKKYILDAPNGPKGGHCVTPNAKLLHGQYPSDLTKIVGEL